MKISIKQFKKVVKLYPNLVVYREMMERGKQQVCFNLTFHEKDGLTYGVVDKQGIQLNYVTTSDNLELHLDEREGSIHVTDHIKKITHIFMPYKLMNFQNVIVAT